MATIMMIKFAWLIPALPLLGFLLNGLGRKFFSKIIVSWVGCGTLLFAFLFSLVIFKETTLPGFNGQTVHLFDFISVGALHIPFDFQIDQLTTLFLLIITGVGFLIHLYSTSYMNKETPEGFARYFSYLNLFVFMMLILVMGGNYVILFIGWEGVGLCSYLLIGFWFKNADYNRAARKAFVMNRIGDLGFLMGIFLLIAQFGTTSFSLVFAQASSLASNDPVLVGITLFLLVGALGKSAQIPLYTWLPDAMAGPTPVSALIHAATMVTAGIYMIARSNILYTLSPTTQTVVAFIGVITAVFAASIALKQYDIKKVLAYSTVSQLGYMFLGLGVGAYTGAVFHVMTHAFFKALLFLGAGSVIHAMGGEQDIRKMGGLRTRMKTTYWTFLVACLAISGVPPFSGFFSKDEILSHAYSQSPLLFLIGLLGALMTAFYMFRLLFITFFGPFRGTRDQEHHLHESPPAMVIPLIILGIFSLIGGWINIPSSLGGRSFLAAYLAPIFATSRALAMPNFLSHSTEITLMGVSTILVLLTIFWAWRTFRNYQESAQNPAGVTKWLEHKWYVDEFYQEVITQPLNRLSKFLGNVVEKSGIDGLVNGVGKGVKWSSQQIRFLQTGQVGFYIFAMVVGSILLCIIGFFIK
ncbi:MAG: NADH-quinone oxidoreductase subunit L [Chitinophagaceae bacterium]